MSERKLASVQKIVSIEDIHFQNEKGETEVAANIVKVGVLGWSCVTQRSNGFKVGDLVCYFEVDSLLPAKPEFEFLRKKPEETQFRLKTIKLKGQIAQGLVLPLSVITKVFNSTLKSDCSIEEYNFIEGMDLTNQLGVEKYEPEIPAHLRGLVKGQFPWFLTKTDETRIQTCPNVLIKHKGKRFVITEKVDGSSITVYSYPNSSNLPIEDPTKEHQFGVCSRNLNLSFSEDNAFWKAAILLNLEEKLAKLNKPIAIQGELIGPGVNKNTLKRKELEVRWFHAYDPILKKYYDHVSMMELFAELGLTTVPVLDDNFILDHTVEQLVTYSTGFSTLNTNEKILREGIVLKSYTEEYEKALGRLSFKVINPSWLIKYD